MLANLAGAVAAMFKWSFILIGGLIVLAAAAVGAVVWLIWFLWDRYAESQTSWRVV